MRTSYRGWRRMLIAKQTTRPGSTDLRIRRTPAVESDLRLATCDSYSSLVRVPSLFFTAVLCATHVPAS